MNKSRIQLSRERALNYNSLPVRPLSCDKDEEQLLGVIYAPNRSGFPDVTLASQLSHSVRPEIAEYVQKLMYTGSDNGFPDVDTALDTIIPSRAQYGQEVEPYLSVMSDYLVNLKKSKSKKDEKV